MSAAIFSRNAARSVAGARAHLGCAARAAASASSACATVACADISDHFALIGRIERRAQSAEVTALLLMTSG